MLGLLTEKMQALAAKFGGKSKLTEANISEAVREVRLALLEADVNYGVAKALVKKLKQAAIGDAVMKSVTPGQQFITEVHNELVALMGGEEADLNLKGNPAVIMMCGLQGSGKTTHTAKLARYLLKNERCKRPLLVACDLQRPAAVEQLTTLGGQIDVTVFSIPGEHDPVVVARAALQEAVNSGHDLMIVDTAGRLQIDDTMMAQLAQLERLLAPQEILFVANATTGQDAVNVAKTFNETIAITGSILTMLDGNSRGGAAISIREVTGKPLKFEGVGEKIDDIQLFNPESMADRILGMGDTINLVKKAQEHISEDDAQDLEEKMRSATFTYNDYLKQIQTFKKMGSFKGLMSMLPGASKFNEMDLDDDQFVATESIIQSMTPDERLCKDELSVSRRKRIAKGCGRKIDDVNRLVKSLKKSKGFFKNMPSKKKLEKMMGGSLWD